MPLYEYQCGQCGATFEKRMTIAESDQRPACPECGSPETHKQMSRVAFRGFSGGGSSAPSSSGSSCGSRGGFS